jgi:hypothetical protein
VEKPCQKRTFSFWVSHDDQAVEIWLTYGKGGATESQREFLEALSLNDGRKPLDRQNAKVPDIANELALGYTYLDVLDADHEGTAPFDSMNSY